MATLYLKRGRWYGNFREFEAFGGRQEALVVPGEKDATIEYSIAKALYDRRLEELLGKRNAQTRPDPTKERGDGLLTLDRCLENFIQRYGRVVDSRVTRDRERHRILITQIMPPSRLVQEITTGHIEDFLETLALVLKNKKGQPYSGSYQAKVVETLRLALNDACHRRYLQSNPAKGISPILLPDPAPMTRTAFYTPEEVGKLLTALYRNADDSIPDDWPARAPYYLLEQVAFVCYTGARRNEMQSQRWEWIDWDRNLLHVYTSKRRRGLQRHNPTTAPMRTIPLWPQLREFLLRLWNHQGRPESGLVFPRLRAATREQKHVPVIERGGRADRSLEAVLRVREAIKGGENGEPFLVFGKPGYQMSWREFRVTYCATRLQTIEPVTNHPGEYVPVAHTTVEHEMGHASAKMVREVYARVAEGPQRRLEQVEYPIVMKEAQVLRLVGRA